MFSELTVAIPVKRENSMLLEKFLDEMKWLFQMARVVVVDSYGGQLLKPYCWKYITKDATLAEARKLCYAEVETRFTLNLDDDTVLPKQYVEEALKLLEQPEVIVVAIDYEKIQGHYAFGTSLWKSEWLKKLYDWKDKSGKCECLWMWAKVHRAHKRIETLPYRAKHLKFVITP